MHPDDALGMLEVGGHLADGERRRVRREDALGVDDGLELGEDLLLDGQLLEDGFEDEIAVCERVETRRSLDRAPAIAELLADRRDGAVDRLLVEVADHERHAEPLEEERRELRRHQAGADDADLLSIRRGFTSGMPTPFFARRSTRSNA